MNTENLSTLKINKLTQAQYDRELEAGRIDENALYLTPDPVDQYLLNPIFLLPTDEVEDCYYRRVGGTIDGEQEWINPPMMNGIRYRTSERHKGKAVYVFRVQESVEAIVMGLTYEPLFNMKDVISITGVTKDSNGRFHDLNSDIYPCHVSCDDGGTKLWIDYNIETEAVNEIDNVMITIKFTLN